MSESQPLVLVVEDEPDLADLYAAWLGDEYRVRTAYGGHEALDVLDDVDGTVDAILLDRRMPGLSGDEVLAAVRERGVDCRVAMVTAVEPDFDILEMGFDAYLSKPIRSDELHTTVEKLLERSEYDSLLQEYYALVEKQATLETAKSGAELAESDEYETLKERIAELQEELSKTLGGVEDDADFITAIQQIGGGDDT